MVTTDTLEGTINGSISYHYDVFADVLYLRLVDEMQTPTIGEENDDGDIVLRDEKTDKAVGLTVISWWKRFGAGALPDSISEIQKQIEPLARKVAAENLRRCGSITVRSGTCYKCLNCGNSMGCS